jgi:hypothetical protein
MKAPAGAVVRIYYDGARVDAGDALRTPTGRCYIVLAKRLQERGKHVGRQHLACIVADEVPAGARVLELHWYRRGKKRSAA